MSQLRIGIDLGGTKIEGVVLDEQHRPIFRTRIPTEQHGGYDHIINRIVMLVDKLRAHVPACTAIGIGTPGALSSVDGTLKNSNTVCLNGRDVHGDLERRLGLRVVMENDANCFALAEAVAGAAHGAELVFGVILGTGVGGGLVINGKVRRGLQHIAGEWGHHSIDPNGPACFCGQRGCVEAHIAGPAMTRQYGALTGEQLPMREIVTRARAGEAQASQLFERFLDRFGRALANVLDIVDPDVVVLGGGLSNIDELYTRGRDAVRRYVCNDELRTPIVRHQLGDSAGVIGAALLVA
ncbi:MAG TPA: ROK family protein [Candidatus Binatia bacterium]|nr:ROK family protein [Candidatus Binatia bacterium]